MFAMRPSAREALVDASGRLRFPGFPLHPVLFEHHRDTYSDLGQSRYKVLVTC